MKKNIIIGLSGGPSCAINASLAGVLKKAHSSPDIGKIYGAVHGIEGVITDNIIDLTDIAADSEKLSLLCQTPAMALGSCRYKLNNGSFGEIEKTLNKYDIKGVFYIGGNDSMDTVLKLNEHLREKASDILVIGIPKTIDNDLPVTDHTPGYGSAAKYLYHTVSEIIEDSRIYPVKNVVICEVMGRNSGWLTLAAGLPSFLGGEHPQIVALPETPFDEAAFIEKIKALFETQNTVVCAVSEGICYKNGEYVGSETKSGAVDIFGHKYLSGVGKYLESLVAHKIGCKVRSIELNVMQRCAAHLSSKTDISEACAIGSAAVDAFLKGKTGVTMIFKRESNSPYKASIAFTDVANIANKAKDVPFEWLDLENDSVKAEICEYLLPLINGDCEQIKDTTGLPKYLRLF